MRCVLVQHTRDFRTKTYGKNKKGNCDLLSHNSDFFFLAIASLYLTILRKKSQNCEIKSRSNLFLFLYSVSEMGFHRNMSNETNHLNNVSMCDCDSRLLKLLEK